MTTIALRIATLAGLGALLATTNLAPANAAVGRFVTAEVAWGPMQCVELNEPNPATGRTSLMNTIDCDGGFTSVSYFAPAGTQIGIDPVMGNNTFISCTVFDSRTGTQIWHDYGTAGDGHDVNCTRTLTSASIVI